MNLLPLTADTENILNHELLSQLQPNAYLINVARGAHLVDADLLRLIADGHIAGATLDVFRAEPLPEPHPFWQQPKITLNAAYLSPHHPRSRIAQIAAKSGFQRVHRRTMDRRFSAGILSSLLEPPKFTASTSPESDNANPKLHQNFMRKAHAIKSICAAATKRRKTRFIQRSIYALQKPTGIDIKAAVVTRLPTRTNSFCSCPRSATIQKSFRTI